MKRGTLTLLYSSSQRSSSRANIHFSTFSIIAFLLDASSLALDICSSMLVRRSEWSISPFVHWSQYSFLVCIQFSRHTPKQSLDISYTHLNLWASLYCPSLNVKESPHVIYCISASAPPVSLGITLSSCLLLVDPVSWLQPRPKNILKLKTL